MATNYNGEALEDNVASISKQKLDAVPSKKGGTGYNLITATPAEMEQYRQEFTRTMIGRAKEHVKRRVGLPDSGIGEFDLSLTIIPVDEDTYRSFQEPGALDSFLETRVKPTHYRQEIFDALSQWDKDAALKFINERRGRRLTMVAKIVPAHIAFLMKKLYPDIYDKEIPELKELRQKIRNAPR